MQITFFLIPCRSGISETTMAKRKVVMETLKELQKYRREITSVDYGSVLFRMVCPTLSALLDLRHLCTSGRLAALVEKIFTIDDFRERKLRKVHVSVTFDPMEFDLCKEELKDAGKLSVGSRFFTSKCGCGLYTGFSRKTLVRSMRSRKMPTYFDSVFK